jgi:hypothetical protein
VRHQVVPIEIANDLTMVGPDYQFISAANRILRPVSLSSDGITKARPLWCRPGLSFWPETKCPKKTPSGRPKGVSRCLKTKT